MATVATISVEDIQSDLHGFLERVQAGEAFLVMRSDAPIATINPVTVVSYPKEKSVVPSG